MSKIFAKFMGWFRTRTLVGVDKHGNRYFTRVEPIDGIMKEKRMVIFKGEEEPVSLPVEWICWLNGQRKAPPTPEEMAELERRREQVKQNTARLKEEEAMKAKENPNPQKAKTVKVSGPDLRSFVRRLKDASVDQSQGISVTIDAAGTAKEQELKKEDIKSKMERQLINELELQLELS